MAEKEYTIKIPFGKKMKKNKYKLKVYGYDSESEIEVSIPSDVKFMSDPSAIGDMLHVNAVHYFTIVKTEKYDKWLNELPWFAHEYNLGDWSVVVFSNVNEKTKLPTVKNEDWFKEIGLNFKDMVIVKYSKSYVPCFALKIIDFENPWKITCQQVSRRGGISYDKECYTMSIENDWEIKYIDFERYRPDGGHYKLYYGEEGQSWWNTMIKDVINKMDYDPTKAVDDFDFDKEQRHITDIIGNDDWKKYVTHTAYD